MLDGAYITAQGKKEILDLLKSVFGMLAEEFINAANQHRFIPKASLAYGPVVHGRDIAKDVNEDIFNNADVRNSILLGLPVIEANAGERQAPPFGVYVDVSARSFAPARTKPIPHAWWRWFNKDDKIRKEMSTSIAEYYEWIEKNKYNQTYLKDRLSTHKEKGVSM